MRAVEVVVVARDCMAMGEGAGTAAAQSIADDVAIPDLDYATLRSSLIEQGAIVDFNNVAALAAES